MLYMSVDGQHPRWSFRVLRLWWSADVLLLGHSHRLCRVRLVVLGQFLLGAELRSAYTAFVLLPEYSHFSRGELLVPRFNCIGRIFHSPVAQQVFVD